MYVYVGIGQINTAEHFWSVATMQWVVTEKKKKKNKKNAK